MKKIITPSHIVESLLSREGRSISFRPWNNRLQKWFFIVAIATFVAGSALAVASKYFSATDLRWVALGALAVSQLAAALYQLAVIVPGIADISNPTKSISELATARFDEDVQTITRLAGTFEQHHLDYARDMLGQLVDQLRYRVGFMLGAIDKVGIFPGAIAGYVYAREILEKPNFSSSGIEWAFAALVAFYILAASLMTVSQRIERAALISRHAAAKRSSDSKTSSSKGG